MDASEDLGLDIASPFDLVLPSGTSIQVPLLIRHFGARAGMLVLSDYSLVERYLEEIDHAGYGFSVMSEPSSHEKYDRAEFIELLDEWGWAGTPSDRPAWLPGRKAN